MAIELAIDRGAAERVWPRRGTSLDAAEMITVVASAQAEEKKKAKLRKGPKEKH